MFAALTPAQDALASAALDRCIFLEGPAGTGKTTAAVARMARLLDAGAPAGELLVVLPQRTLAAPYIDVLRRPATPAGGEATVLTIGGLAQRMIDLFWPLVAERGRFGRPDRPPIYLTLETAQYFMARLVQPLLDEGYFDDIPLDRNRLYSQILDNLNKAAVVGFDVAEIGERLKAAWVGKPTQLRVYDEAQECALRFREYCLAHNLLDFSLQYELFARDLWALPACRDYLTSRYRRLIIDNVEEDTPVAHDILLDWLPACGSALVVFDAGAGYRRFLGADPASGYRLKGLCDEHVAFAESLVMGRAMAAFGEQMRRALQPKPLAPAEPPQTGRGRARRRAEELDLFAPLPAGAEPVPEQESAGDAMSALDFTAHRFHPEMLDWVAARIAGLVHDEGAAPEQIAVLAPFVSGALRFSLESRLAAHGVPARSHRPSRALREEPHTLCLLTLAALCHPGWQPRPSVFDVAYALMLTIGDLDLVRAQLLAQIAYRPDEPAPCLGAFGDIEPAMQERLTFVLGGRYEGLRSWLSNNVRPEDERRARRRGASRRREAELDHFLARLFGELLSQPGYAFHGSTDAGEITAKVIESARKFRRTMALAGDDGASASDLASMYRQLVQEGVVAAQYVRGWQRPPQNAVLIAPAYTFLIGNRPVDHQFWIDAGSSGWWERLNQPLTQPYVLSRRWQRDEPWTDLAEYFARQETLAALALGLVRRCRTQVHLGLAEMDEGGNQQRGALLLAIQGMLRAQQRE